MKVMKKFGKKSLATFLATAMVLAGVSMAAPEAKEVKATDDTTLNAAQTITSDNTLFAGYYDDSGNVLTDNSGTAKYVDAGILSLKMQVADDDVTEGTKKLRIVSSVDSLNYKRVGFEVYFKGATTPIIFKTSTVLERINANATGGVEYNFSPKVVNPDSEYFVTGTLTGILADNLKETFYIRPFWITMDNTPVYGEGRYFTVNEATSDTNINIPVKMDAAPATVSETDSTITDTVTVGGTEYTAKLADYRDGYAHVNITVPSKTALVAASTVTVGTGSTIYRNLESDVSGDMSWYTIYKDAGKSKFVIANESDFNGFATLTGNSTNYDLTANTDEIYIVSDLEFNENAPSTYEDWQTYITNSNPATYTQLGKYSFRGTLDGQGHTLKGIYLPGTTQVGLFKVTGSNAKIQNFKITNSYFSGTTKVGSVIGEGSGQIADVYSEAIIYASESTGGIGGFLGTISYHYATVKDSWFNGTIYGKSYVGGIIGHQPSGKNYSYIQGCLFTGTINATSGGAYIGGLMGEGYGSSGKGVSFKDNLSIGTMNITDCTDVGSVIGAFRWQSTEGYEDTFYYSTTATQPAGNRTDWNSCFVALDELPTGIDAKTTLGEGLDWEECWMTVKNSTPVLRKFMDEAAGTCADVSWYTDEKYTADGAYLLKDEAALYGFAELAKTNAFSGKIIKLDDDMKLNTGNASTWGTTAPANEWEPIGDWGEAASGTPSFEGVFDGQGHSISGVFVSSAQGYLGLFGGSKNACFKNLIIYNSYICSTRASGTSAVGSIVGFGYGTFENVYSDAILTAYGEYTGGILGRVTGATALTECWFDGMINNKGENARITGGLLGGIYGTGSYIMNDCLNSGDISNETGTKNPVVGGLVGESKGTSSMTNCLSIGLITINTSELGETGRKYVGSVIANMAVAATLTRTYGLRTSYQYTSDAGTTYDWAGYQSALSYNGEHLRSLVQLTGTTAIEHTGFDFYDAESNPDGVWLAVNGSTPILKCFEK